MQNVMYIFVWKSEHLYEKNNDTTLRQEGISLHFDLYMTWKD